ncbi:MAG: hypothetical protein J0H08_09825 [Rhizobiales bacterium]|nr:hypothetical protein [Hyphomicrobiales bacterium]
MTASLSSLGALPLPALVMIAGGVLLFLLRGLARDAATIAVPLVALALVWVLPEGIAGPLRWLGYDLMPFRSDASAFARRTAARRLSASSTRAARSASPLPATSCPSSCSWR